jgi:hypothetical protein
MGPRTRFENGGGKAPLPREWIVTVQGLEELFELAGAQARHAPIVLSMNSGRHKPSP